MFGVLGYLLHDYFDWLLVFVSVPLVCAHLVVVQLAAQVLFL